MEVTALWRYPVKSFAGLAESSLDITPGGPGGDRRWAVVDAATGDKVTAREARQLLAVRAWPTADGVRIEAPDGTALDVACPVDGVRVTPGFKQLSHAYDAGDAAAAYLSTAIGRDVRLVWQADVTDRSSRRDLGGLEGGVLSLADAGPILLTTQASLTQLQEWVGPEPALSMSRFRPNVVIDGEAPFAEETWPKLTIGTQDFRVQGPCPRCVMTTIDPVTLAGGHEPIRTLNQHRKREGQVWFGIWLVPLGSGRISVSDHVVV